MWILLIKAQKYETKTKVDDKRVLREETKDFLSLIWPIGRR